MRIFIGILVSSLVTACGTTAYKDEGTQIGSAASAIAAGLPTKEAIAKVAALSGDGQLDAIMLGAPIEYSNDCAQGAYDGYGAFVAAIAQDQSSQDRAYAKLMSVPACSVKPFGIAAKDSAADAGKQADAAAKKPASSAADEAAEKKLKRAKKKYARQEQPSAPAMPGTLAAPAASSADPAAVPCPQKVCRLEDFTQQIAAYGKAIQAAAEGKDIDKLKAAIADNETAIKNLAKAADASPIGQVIPDVLGSLQTLAVQEAQYQAMKYIVLRFDDLWPNAAPAVEKAARLRQGLLFGYYANASYVAADQARVYLNNKVSYNSPSQRLWLFSTLNGKVDAAAQSMKSAALDPAQVIAAFTAANHALALAMVDPLKQKATLIESAKNLQTQINALIKASAQ